MDIHPLTLMRLQIFIIIHYSNRNEMMENNMGEPKKRKLVITDHAILRCLERVYGADIEAMKDHLAKQVGMMKIPDLLFKPACEVTVKSNGISYMLYVEEDGETCVLKTVFKKN